MLLDSNIIIYSVQPAHGALRGFIAASSPVVSATSYVEVLGYHRLTSADRDSFLRFFGSARILPITEPVLEQAVGLRQQRSMSLGDSLIAATALVHGLTLVTHNVNDFRWIAALKLFDPLVSTNPP